MGLKLMEDEVAALTSETTRTVPCGDEASLGESGRDNATDSNGETQEQAKSRDIIELSRQIQSSAESAVEILNDLLN